MHSIIVILISFFFLVSMDERPFTAASTHSDYIIILGQKLGREGLCANAKLRVKEGVACWENLRSVGRQSRFILTGGVTSSIKISEASAMKEELLLCLKDRCDKLQVLVDESFEDCIQAEEEALSTIDNAIKCLPLVTATSRDLTTPPTVHVVTSDYHMPRSLCIFKHVFASNAAIFARPAASVYEQQKFPRAREERPKNLEEWYLCELLEIEVNATKALPTKLRSYGLPDLPEYEVDQALAFIYDMYG